jgi:uncharacterized protein YbjT (DUF2867 family)
MEPDMTTPPVTSPIARLRRVAIAGATGLVRQHLLEQMLADETVSQVYVLGRREPALRHPKLTTLVVDFARLPTLPALDEVYLALGTTIRQAGSQSAFRAVDFEANLATAQAAMAAGARRIALVSAAGANADSRVFYTRTKGELENALTALAPDALLIARPALLLGDRSALGQPARPMESWSQCILRRFSTLLPLGWRPIAAERVARALTSTLPTSTGVSILGSAEMLNVERSCS